MRHQSGFSLIEILVSIALLSIMSGIGISLFAIVNNSYNRANTISAIQSQGSSLMEQIERSIRSASAATVSPDYGCLSGASQCLSLAMPTDSLEYQTNGNCEVTEYDWIAPTSSSNGRLQRAWKNKDGSACNGSATDLFSIDAKDGISVERVNGQTGVFAVTTSANSPTSVLVALDLKQGVSLKPASGDDNRSQVPFITTVSLRKYAN
jgi:prepilin-type N-terminal cleavage/methylation domain-containing protein